MCLSIDKEKTYKMKNRKKRKFTAYKCLVLFCGKLKGPYEGMYGVSTNWKPGIVKSNRTSNKLTEQEKRCGRIYRGIHVYLNKRKAEGSARICGYVVIAVQVNLKDFVATNNGCAVFSQVELSKEEYDNVFKAK